MKLSQGHEPIDLNNSILVAIYTNDRVQDEICNTNSTVMQIKIVNSDGAFSVRPVKSSR